MRPGERFAFQLAGPGGAGVAGQGEVDGSASRPSGRSSATGSAGRSGGLAMFAEFLQTALLRGAGVLFALSARDGGEAAVDAAIPPTKPFSRAEGDAERPVGPADSRPGLLPSGLPPNFLLEFTLAACHDEGSFPLGSSRLVDRV